MTTIIRTPGLGRLAAVESRLFLREPLAVFFAIGLPAALLLILGSAIPSFRDPSPELGGLRPVDAQLPGMMVLLSVATLALSTLPTALVVYRERGVLRRMSTTPVRPAALLAVQLGINAVVAVVATTLTLVLGHLVLDAPFPRALFGFTVVVVLGAVAMFALGLFLAAVAPNSRIVQGVGAGALFPLLFFAGMWLPRDLMPEALRRVSDFTPTGAFGQGLVDTLGGHAPSALHLAVMAGWAVVAVIAAARSFRWQ
ncbi:ABC transporter permease [Planotetraspora phitsanulokensis]|uniref:Transport permease protein n=1 Tax=Planotetraspora phitsanulokensis TaxID=575192 RepID=A0A8J3XFP8_9ACTN|nr:ABC transporter permease [Planotetraspora phitsanulokensis]GII39937.1 transport permease protein [Planotetraspora phitsanulokensis]